MTEDEEIRQATLKTLREFMEELQRDLAAQLLRVETEREPDAR
jgi:hypothetical protein